MENKLAVFCRSFRLKSLAVRRIVSGYGHFLRGFYTRELRKNNRLYGYELVSLSGGTEVLAGKDFVSGECFNKYAVNKKAVEVFAVRNMEETGKGEILLVDELGPIFLQFEVFRNALTRVLASEKDALFFSRSLREVGDTLEKLDNIRVIELDEKGYESVLMDIESWIYEKIKSRKSLSPRPLSQ